MGVAPPLECQPLLQLSPFLGEAGVPAMYSSLHTQVHGPRPRPALRCHVPSPDPAGLVRLPIAHTHDLSSQTQREPCYGGLAGSELPSSVPREIFYPFCYPHPATTHLSVFSTPPSAPVLRAVTPVPWDEQRLRGATCLASSMATLSRPHGHKA